MDKPIRNWRVMVAHDGRGLLVYFDPETEHLVLRSGRDGNLRMPDGYSAPMRRGDADGVSRDLFPSDNNEPNGLPF